MVKISEIKFDHLKEPIGIEQIPKVSWIIESDESGVSQKQYQVQLSLTSDFSMLVYDSEWVESSQSTQVSLPELVIETAKKYFVRVRITTLNEERTEWKNTSFITGILNSDQWKAQFITAEAIDDKESSKGTYIRGAFEVKKQVKEAYTFTSALGVYKAYINGEKIGTDELAPGWTSYQNRLMYQTNEVTNLVVQGTNIIGASLGAGWFKGKMGFLDERNNYGDYSAFIGQILVRYWDDTEEWFYTNHSYVGIDSPIVFSEIYDGEIFDSNQEVQNWNTKDANLDHWHPVRTIPWSYTTLVSQPGSRVKVIERIQPKAILITPNQERVIDFGQNLTGWMEFSYQGEKDEELEFQFFETLDKEGNVYIDNLRSAKQTIRYICSDERPFRYHPSFTFQGFRYVHVKKYTAELTCDNFEACVVHSEMELTGYIHTANQDVNQLYHNMLWSMKGNFLDVPTDCPQRNERCGWTGDVQIFCQTALYLMNSYPFLAKWLKDVAADQTAEGGIPHVVPDIVSGKEKDDWLLSQGTHSAAGWADVAVTAPWDMYLTYGDTTILEEQFSSMKAWIDFMHEHSENNIWNYKLQFGDWLALDAQEGSYFGATPNDLTCTAFYANSTHLFSKIAAILDRDELAKYYQNLHKNIVMTFREKFISAFGDLLVQTQTAHILVLKFKLAPVEFEKKIAENLVNLLEKNDGKLTTGFLGTPYICQVLSDFGHEKEAYDLLLRTEFPSWLYQVQQGATTIWEHWDGIKPDGTMWSPDMNSFNHYAYGSIGEWLFATVIGIRADEKSPGFKHTVISPKIDARLGEAKGCYHSPYGDIEVHWKIQEETCLLSIKIPHNTSANLQLDNLSYFREIDKDTSFVLNKGCLNQELVSGTYQFEFQHKK
ncbi:alpha-L-rhamnosidase [Enterococcus sp. JM4C]|uniref:alpha-L-rhamnosidase n=1 Tax=Candidatus Enterococcus huntleyi TaxID=1857217 RepID=UPI0013793C85|nr:alpha-L-rhamnosidase [Enterococcus sp. JM4C]KAF1299405.1 alpha-L-rhamnosidase [Enterococcus sp. JM4C]